MDDPIDTFNWKLIWKLNVTAKVQNFLCRNFFSSLPTMRVLRIGRVDVPE